MKKQRKSIFVLALLVTFLGSSLFFSGLVIAGDLDPTAPPGPPPCALGRTGSSHPTPR